MTHTFRKGDKVRRKQNLPLPRYSRRAFIPGVQGAVGGCAASCLILNYTYTVTDVRPDGSLILQYFSLPVSAKDVEAV